MNQNEIVTFYRHSVKDLSGKQISYIYTETQEDFDDFSKGLESLVLVVMIKYLAIGMLIGMLIGFFTATQANELVKAEITKNVKYPQNANILIAIAKIESSYNPRAVGKANEVGLFQLHPMFFKHLSTNSSIKVQVQKAEEHLTWLQKHCKTHISLCWNLGIKGAMEIKNPTEFGYYKKYTKALLNEQKKKATKNIRSIASNQRKVLHSKNSYSEIREGQIKSIAWAVGRRREYNLLGK